MKALSPLRDPNKRIPTPTPRLSRHTHSMAIRIGVQADSQDECAEALAQLVDRGYVPTMLPAQVAGDRWLARAVPAPAATRVEEPVEP